MLNIDNTHAIDEIQSQIKERKRQIEEARLQLLHLQSDVDGMICEELSTLIDPRLLDALPCKLRSKVYEVASQSSRVELFDICIDVD